MLKMMEKQFLELERETVQALSQMSEIRKKIREVSGMDDTVNYESMGGVEIPFVAYEMLGERHKEEKSEMEERFLKEKEQIHERHEREKDKMRKHYRNLILWIAIPFLTFIVAVFGLVGWVLFNYDIVSWSQDGSGINNYAYESTQGDLNYEPNYPHDTSEEAPQG